MEADIRIPQHGSIKTRSLRSRAEGYVNRKSEQIAFRYGQRVWMNSRAWI